MKGKNLQLKTAFRAVMLILMLGSVGIMNVYAYDFSAVCSTGQTLYYNITDAENHYVALTYPGTSPAYPWIGFTKPTGVMILPDIIEYNAIQYSVKIIGSDAFSGCSGLTSLTIPNSVTSIGSDAFYGCSGLTSLTIPNTVTSIGSGVFSYCTGLISLTIPNSITSISSSAFYGCTGLTTLTIPNTVTSIGSVAFSDCTGLTLVNYLGDIAQWCNITFGSGYSNPLCYAHNLYINDVLVTNLIVPETVTEVKQYAFYGCSGLTSLTIPNTVTSIGYGAFSGCSGLTSITIGNSVVILSDYSFYNCNGLASIIILAATPPTINTHTFYNVSKTIPVYIPCGTLDAYQSTQYWNQFTIYQEDCNITFEDANVKALCVANWDTNGDGELSYDEAAAVTNLGTVFENNTSITSFDELQYFTGLTNIGAMSFYRCTRLTSVIIPNTVTAIGESAFDRCSTLTSVTFGNSVSIFGTNAFSQCSGLTSVYYTGNLKQWCDIIWEAGFSNPVYYASNLYFNNELVTEIVIPQDVTEIKDSAFRGYIGLTSLTISNSVTNVGVSAFSRCSELSSITLGNSVTSIGSGAFSWSGITGQLIIPNSVTSIGEDAFYNCSGITGELTIPNSITVISDQTFAYCTGLTSVTIPNSVTSIDNMAFYGCEALTSIDFSSTIAYIESSAFTNTGWYNSQANGILYLNNWCIGYKGDAPTGVLNIDDNTVGIASNAFASCNNLTGSLIIPNTVIYIGDNAFNWCNGLTSLTIGTSVTCIGAGAFYCCYNLTGSLVIPNSVTNIGSQSFDNCSGLTSLSIGPSVTNIGNSAFYKCTGVTTITSLAINPPTIGNKTFYNVNKSIPVYVIYGSLDTYQSATGWSEFTNYHTTAYVTISGYGNSTSSDKWAFIASPLADDIEPEDIDGLIATIPVDYDLYQLNPAATNEWENWKQTGDHYHFNLVNGKGYLYANRNDVNIILQGDMFTGDYKDVTLQTGWNLVGNPYAQSAYINRSYYKMNAAGDDIEAVSAYTTTAIPVCTGVVVQGASNSDVVRFTKTAPSKSTGNGGLQMTLAKAGNRGNEMQDKAIVIFEENVQLGKYIFNENHAKLYIPQNGNDYAIAYSDGQSEIQLYFRTKEMGTYTINFNNDAELINVYLVDKFEGAVIDLSVCSSYTFIGSSADRPDRFELVFGSPTESEADNFAYQSGNEIIVNGDGELQVFDVMGRMVAKLYVNGIEMIAKPSVNGVYIFRLNEKTQKIVVK